MQSKFVDTWRRLFLMPWAELAVYAFWVDSKGAFAFWHDFRQSGLRWLFYASLAGLLVSVAFLAVDSLTLAESGFVTQIRILIVFILLFFGFCTVRFKVWVLSYYNLFVSVTLCLVLLGVIAIVGTPGVVVVGDGFSTGPLLVFCLFLIYGFVRLPLVFLVCIGCLFSVSILVLEGKWSEGPGFHRLILYAILSNFFGMLLAFFIVQREYLLFRERNNLRLSREGLRQRAAELQASKDDMRRLMRAVDHDLKQPLLAADFSINALQSMLVDSVAPDCIARLSELKRVVAFLRSSAEDVLSLAAIDERGFFDLSPVDLGVVVRDVLTICAPLARSEGVELRSRLSSGSLEACSNKAVVSRVLLNLVVNAVKFSSSKHVGRGSVLITVRRLDGRLRLGVYDQGPGIGDADRDKVWEPFFRVSSSSTVDGSGLGLYLVRRMVQGLRGHSVVLVSRLGKGSCFSVTTAVPHELDFRFDDSAAVNGGVGVVGAYVIIYAESGPVAGRVRAVLVDLGVDVEVVASVGSLNGLAVEVERMVDAFVFVSDCEVSSGVWADVQGFRQAVHGQFPIGLVGANASTLFSQISYGDRVLDVAAVSFRRDLAQMVAAGVSRNIAIEARD